MGTSGIALGTSISIILALIYGIFDLNRKLDIIQVCKPLRVKT